MEPDIHSVEAKIVEAITALREAIDISVTIKASGPPASQQINKLWEKFLGEFFSYIRQRSKETKQNLLAGISFPRIF